MTSLLTYILCCIISSAAWFFLIKLRQGGFRIPLPENSNLLDPLNHGNVNYKTLMLGWLIMTVFWFVGWPFLILFYVLAWIVYSIIAVYNLTIGNEKFAKRIFGGRN